MTPARVLSADPPWKFQDALGGKENVRRGAALHYPCLSVEELCSFALPNLESSAVLFLWRVSSMVEEAYQVVRAWGFVPKSEIVWKKTTKHGRRHFGMGRYVRAEHETCIIAVRGRMAPKVRNVRSVIEAPVGRHSAKPEAFYDEVERLYDGPYVELFARRQRPGWLCLGNEVPGCSGLEAIA